MPDGSSGLRSGIGASCAARTDWTKSGPWVGRVLDVGRQRLLLCRRNWYGAAKTDRGSEAAIKASTLRGCQGTTAASTLTLGTAGVSGQAVRLLRMSVVHMEVAMLNSALESPRESLWSIHRHATMAVHSESG